MSASEPIRGVDNDVARLGFPIRGFVKNSESNLAQVLGFRHGLFAVAQHVGPTHEWHVVLDKSFEHLQFGLMSWLDELIILLGSSFSLARFKPIRSISDTMNGDGIKQVLVKIHPE